MISELVAKLWEQTGIYNYDPSASEVFIAGYPLVDLTNVKVNRSSPNKSEDGIHQEYYTYSKQVTRPTITVSVLPYGKDHYFLWKLYDWVNANGGGFIVSVKNNGSWIGQFKCHFSDLADDEISREANDSTFVFKGIEMSIGVFQ